MRQAAFFSDNNYQDYEFTRLNTYEKKEMSEELTIILSNNYYWNQPFDEVNLGGIFGNYCPRKPCGLPHYINHFCSPTYFSCAKIVISHDFLLLLQQNSSKPTKPTNT